MFIKNSLKIAAVFTGTFIGAGFASGQEIMQYFTVYGKKGIVGAIISTVLFFVFCYTMLYNFFELGEENFMKKSEGVPFYRYISTGFMSVMFLAMVNAGGEAFCSTLDMPKLAGVVIMALICGFILLFGSSGIVRFNSVVTPVIVIGIIIVWIASVYKNTVAVMAGLSFAGSAVIYVSYNTITLSSVAVSLKEYITDKKTILCASVLCSMAVLLLILCLIYILFDMPIGQAELPVLDAVSDKYKMYYFPVLLLAIITTAVSNGYGAVVMCKLDYRTAVFSLCIIAVSLYFISFSFIVNYFYRFFGFIGLIVFVNNFYIFIKNKKIREKSRNI